jgi:hypothetical protein
MNFAWYGHLAVAGIAVAANIATICAAALAFYIFFSQRKKLGAALNALIGYSFQLTLSEIKEKLERLNDLNVSNDEQREKVHLLLSELVGQLNGNATLRGRLAESIRVLERMVSSGAKLTEPKKRTIVSQLREQIRQVGIHGADKLTSSPET